MELNLALAPSAREAVVGLADKGRCATYAEMCDRLHECFGVPKEEGAFEEELEARVQQEGESLQTWGVTCGSLVERAYVGQNRAFRDRQAVRRFVKGIRDRNVRIEVKRGAVGMGFAATKRYARRAEELVKEMHEGCNDVAPRNEGRSRVKAVRAMKRAYSPREENEEEQKGWKASADQLLQQLAGYAKQKYAADGGSATTESKATAPATRGAKRQAEQPMRCFNCNKLGHTWRMCTRPTTDPKYKRPVNQGPQSGGPTKRQPLRRPRVYKTKASMAAAPTAPSEN